MKLPKGITITIGNKSYSDEVPDKLLNDEQKKAIERASGKPEKKQKTVKADD